MPELPEVETARSLIADQALDRTIVGVDDSDAYVTRPHPPGQLRDALLGRRLTAARRRGKSIWVETSGLDGNPEPGPDLGIHLGMTGRIVVTAPGGGKATEGGGDRREDARPRKPEWDRFTIQFADGGQLALFDTRRLGRVRLDPDISALGPDAGEITPEEFRRVLGKAKIAGVGNLLADETLWQARINPAVPVNRLRPADVDRLYRALRSALENAAANGGAHTGEGIHGTVGGRSTWWCSLEQA